MYEDYTLQTRIAQAAQALQEALQVSMPPSGPHGVPGQPLGPPQGPQQGLQPPPTGPAPLPSALQSQDQGQLGLGPNQKPSPLQAVPSFRSTPFEAVLQKAAGRAQAPTGFARGGRVRSFRVDMP